MKEIGIGKIVEIKSFDGRKFLATCVAVDGEKDCADCLLYPFSSVCKQIVECSKSERSDGKDVIFQEVKQ